MQNEKLLDPDYLLNNKIAIHTDSTSEASKLLKLFSKKTYISREIIMGVGVRVYDTYGFMGNISRLKRGDTSAWQSFDYKIVEFSSLFNNLEL